MPTRIYLIPNEYWDGDMRGNKGAPCSPINDKQSFTSEAAGRSTRALRNLYALGFIGLVMALLTPQSLAASPYVYEFVSEMGERIPAINAFGHASLIPELTRFWFASMWIIWPIFAFIFVVQSTFLPSVTFRQLWRFLLIAPPFLWLITYYYLYWAPFLSKPIEHCFFKCPLGDIALTLILDYRLGLAIIGSAFFVITAFISGVWIKSIWLLLVRSYRFLMGQ